jgi:hypothetical protein
MITHDQVRKLPQAALEQGMNKKGKLQETVLDVEHLPSVGWREWIRLPDLCKPWIKAKIDTGAKTSALHAHDIEVFMEKGMEMVRFTIHPHQSDTERAITIITPVIDHRNVRSSHGRTTFRPVIVTTMELMNQKMPIEMTLVGRHSMKFRILIGRQALRGRFLVNSGESYLGGRWRRKRNSQVQEMLKPSGETS